MKNLIIGASGQVGEHLHNTLKNLNQSVTGTYYPDARDGLVQLDIRDRQAVADLLQQLQPEIVYLPAAITNVEYCEENPKDTYQTNVLGTRNVVLETNRIKAKLVFFSSDYVFDGENGPYTEMDPINPISHYGLQKVYGEHFITSYSENYLIIRTTVVFGWESQGKNFVQRLLNSLKADQSVRVPIDQIGSPTYAPNLAETVIELASKDESGIFHIVGTELANRYEFSIAAAEIFGLDQSLIIPVSTSELGQIAPRPLKAGMRTNKAQKVLDTPLISYQAGLKKMKSEIR